MQRTSLLPLLVSAVLLSGCASSIVATRIVTAPNRNGAPSIFKNDRETQAILDATYAQQLRVPVGPPKAKVAVAVVEPGDYGHEYEITVDEDWRKGSAKIDIRFGWSTSKAAEAPRPARKGTIVLLHGVWMNKESMLHWGLHLAQQGYRTVLVDLRGHGKSTGRWLTFGAAEAGDLAQVIDALQRRGLADDRVGVLGTSYGAAIALLWAARDPRVATVVALEPYSEPETAIRDFTRAMLPENQSARLNDELLATSTAKAAKRAGFDWREVNVKDAMARVKVPVLFFHGVNDGIIPPSHSRALMEVAPTGSRLRLLAHENHFTLPMRLEPIAGEVVAWFDGNLTASEARPAGPPKPGGRSDLARRFE